MLECRGTMFKPAASTTEFTELWRDASKLCHGNIQDKKQRALMSKGTASPLRPDFQSPQRKGCSKFLSLNNGDSPGDVEPSQDIFWDPTSPTPASTGLRNTKVVEISDIVNRIAPKDVKCKEAESTLLQWIGDSAVPCTPDVPKPRLRKRSSRHSSVEDLMKLARQFDENMQQDRETSEHLNAINKNLNECANTPGTKPTEASFHTNAEEPKCLSSPDQVEAELQALFDCSTQKVSGGLSQGNLSSACSQEIKKQTEPRLSEPKTSTEKSDSAAHPAGEKGSCGFGDDFDDDWENDDLLNDSYVLAITQNSLQPLNNNSKTSMQSKPKTNTSLPASVCSRPAANASTNVQLKPTYSALQQLCPKPKTSHRSTFKLEPNPHFNQRPSKISEHKVSPPGNTVREISDSHWDNRDDDALLLLICDNVESVSNDLQKQVSQDEQNNGVKRAIKTTAPLPIETTLSKNSSLSTNRQSSGSFVRSNSLPGTSYQGWDTPMKGANNAGMSQSLPGSHMSLGLFSDCRDSSGTVQAGNVKVEVKPRTVTAGTSQDNRSHHTAFKRNVSDSAVINNKVFVTSQMTAKCSAAEIERKKQEALARRRQRMQNSQKP